jgi:hypothetical protein
VLLEVDEALYGPGHDQLLRKEFLYKFGKNMRVNIQHVPEIPREANGKYRMIKNDVQL